MLKTDVYFVIMLMLMLVIVIERENIEHEHDYEHEHDSLLWSFRAKTRNPWRNRQVLALDPSTSLRMTVQPIPLRD
jgi:hypothetical protein